jgi:hypothetical protein
MTLLIWYIGLVAIGDVIAYFAGLAVERQFGSYPSMVAFIAMYFVVLWVAWQLSVRITAPRKEAAA